MDRYEYKSQHQDKTKNASAKDDLSLLPWGAVPHVARVMMYGANKYAPLGFYNVPNRRWTYIKAAMRHMTKFFIGVARGVDEPLDRETHLPHTHHAAACLMIAIDDACDDADDSIEVDCDSSPDTARSRRHTPVKSKPIIIGETD